MMDGVLFSGQAAGETGSGFFIFRMLSPRSSMPVMIKAPPLARRGRYCRWLRGSATTFTERSLPPSHGGDTGLNLANSGNQSNHVSPKCSKSARFGPSFGQNAELDTAQGMGATGVGQVDAFTDPAKLS